MLSSDDYDSMTTAMLAIKQLQPNPNLVFGFCMAAVQYAGHYIRVYYISARRRGYDDTMTVHS